MSMSVSQKSSLLHIARLILTVPGNLWLPQLPSALVLLIHNNHLTKRSRPRSGLQVRGRELCKAEYAVEAGIDPGDGDEQGSDGHDDGVEETRAGDEADRRDVS